MPKFVRMYDFEVQSVTTSNICASNTSMWRARWRFRRGLPNASARCLAMS